CRWKGCGDGVCDAGEQDSCPGDCPQDGGHVDQLDCCQSADDTCHQSGDGICQSGCAWGHDPDCDPQPPIDDSHCCSDPSDPCGWNGDGVCDAGCAFVDIDCQPEHCDQLIVDPLQRDPLHIGSATVCKIDTARVQNTTPLPRPQGG